MTALRWFLIVTGAVVVGFLTGVGINALLTMPFTFDWAAAAAFLKWVLVGATLTMVGFIVGWVRGAESAYQQMDKHVADSFLESVDNGRMDEILADAERMITEKDQS